VLPLPIVVYGGVSLWRKLDHMCLLRVRSVGSHPSGGSARVHCGELKGGHGTGENGVGIRELAYDWGEEANGELMVVCSLWGKGRHARALWRAANGTQNRGKGSQLHRHTHIYRYRYSSPPKHRGAHVSLGRGSYHTMDGSL